MIRPKWVNIEDEGAIHMLLGRLAEAVPPDAIDSVWILPTRRAGGFESTVVVLSVYDPTDPLRRRVGAVRWLVSRDRKGRATVEEQMHEYALAPADAIQRVVEGVMRRLGDSAIEPPAPGIIEGSAERWTELLRSLGAPPEPEEPEVLESTDADATGQTDESPGDTPLASVSPHAGT